MVDVLIVCALLFIGISGLGFRSIRRLERTGCRTFGTVVSLRHEQHTTKEEGRVRTTGGSYFPTLEFGTADERTIRAETRVGTGRPPAQPGDEVKVIYDPDDPTNVRIDSFTGRGGKLFLIVGAVGVVMLAMAMYQMATLRPPDPVAGAAPSSSARPSAIR